MQNKIIILSLICFVFVSIVSAHPGGLDKNGGHYCWTNCSKWGLEYGEYHCHTATCVIPVGTASPTVTVSQGQTPTITPTPTSIPSITPTISTPESTAYVPYDRIAKVTSIVDGDTVYVDNRERVRFVGINTPEIGQLGSLEARKYVSDRIQGKQIYLDVDDAKTKDKYGRILAVILINGENLNKELLCKGYAEVMYIPPSEFNPYSWQSSCPNASIESNISITPVLSDTYKVVSTPIETTAPGVTITPYVTPVVTVTQETELGVKTGWLEEKINALLKWFRWV